MPKFTEEWREMDYISFEKLAHFTHTHTNSLYIYIFIWSLEVFPYIENFCTKWNTIQWAHFITPCVPSPTKGQLTPQGNVVTQLLHNPNYKMSDLSCHTDTWREMQSWWQSYCYWRHWRLSVLTAFIVSSDNKAVTKMAAPFQYMYTKLNVSFISIHIPAKTLFGGYSRWVAG